MQKFSGKLDQSSETSRLQIVLLPEVTCQPTRLVTEMNTGKFTYLQRGINVHNDRDRETFQGGEAPGFC